MATILGQEIRLAAYVSQILNEPNRVNLTSEQEQLALT